MTEIVPAINVRSFAEVARQIRLAEKHVRRVHIDVADGSFTPYPVWHDAGELVGFTTPVSIEIHFMVTDPLSKLTPWLAAPMDRLIFHVEATDDPRAVIDTLHNAHKEVGLSITPTTSAEALLPYANDVQLFQTLAVSPGPSGQSFDATILEKISYLKHHAPHVLIEVDGGIKTGIARSCAQAGAALLVVGAALFAADKTFDQTLEELQKDVQ